MYNIKKEEKEFIATNRLMYKGKHMGYKGHLNIRGKLSNTCDITLFFVDTIERDFHIKLNTVKLGSDIEMIADGKSLYSDKDCPVLQFFNIYKILGFNDYKKNNTLLLDKYRSLCEKYFNNQYRNAIIVLDTGLKRHVEVKMLNKDAIEVVLNSRTVKDREDDYLLYALIEIDSYKKTSGKTGDLTKYIETFNNEHNLSVPYHAEITTENNKTKYTCLTCKRNIELTRKIPCLKNYRCRCGGLIQKVKE